MKPARPAARGRARPEWIPFAASAGIALGLACALGRSGGPGGDPIPLSLGLWGAGLGALVFFPRRLPFRRAALLVLALGVAARALVLPLPASDDVHRYLWEGRVTAAGLSPYLHPPSAPPPPPPSRIRDGARDPHRLAANHPEMTAIYPPLMELLFAGIASLWYSPGAVKGLMGLLDLAALALLLLLLRERKLDPRWGLLYALQPVMLLSFAGRGHLDVIQILLLLAAIRLHDRGRWGWMFLAAGLAVEVKYGALLALPFLVRRDNLRHAWIAAAAAVAPALYFLPGGGAGPLLRSALEFGGRFAFNGPVHGILRPILGGIEPASLACLVLLAALWAAATPLLHPSRKGSPVRDPVPGILLATGALLLLSPTVHFWYVAWIVPFVAIRPAPSWMLLLGTIAFALAPEAAARRTGLWASPAWVPWGVWAGPGLLLALELRLAILRLRGGGRGGGAPWPAPRDVSVVVPARNEAAHIGECIEAARRDPCVREIVVVDGGSRDGTAGIARGAGARVIEHALPPEAGGGRGGQILAGCRAATGDVVAVVHADARVEAGTFGRILDLLGRRPDCPGGAVGCVFDGPGWGLRLVELANDLRAAFLGIAFGDQLQFFRRRAVVERGLFPAIPLMEDVELSFRLARLGRVCFLWGGAACRVSARRWRDGVAPHTLLVVALTAEHLARRAVGRSDPVGMYRRYYREDPALPRGGRPVVSSRDPGSPAPPRPGEREPPG